jgi:hypothetical protein
MIWDGRYVSIQPVTPSRSTTTSTAASRATGPAEVAADTPSIGPIAATTGALLSWSSWRWKSTRAPYPHR